MFSFWNVVKCALISFNKSLFSTAYRNDWLKLTFSCFFATQSGEHYFQLTNHLIWFVLLQLFTSNKTNMYEIKWKRQRSQILTCLIFTVLFSKKSRFHWKKKPFRKSWGRTRLYWYRWHWKLRGFTYTCVHWWGMWECLIVVHNGGELTRNINQKKKLDVLQ